MYPNNVTFVFADERERLSLHLFPLLFRERCKKRPELYFYQTNTCAGEYYVLKLGNKDDLVSISKT